MKRCRLAGFVIVVMACGLIAHPGAQVANRAEVLLQAARTKQLVERRLEEAIDLYQQVVKQAGTNRALKAEALLGEAQSYETLGRPVARAKYEALAKEYADQPNVARKARNRLTAFGPATPQSGGLVPRRVLTSGSLRIVATSADGQLAVAHEVAAPGEPGSMNLIAIDLVTQQTTRLVTGSQGSAFATNPVFSPDGRQVAYQWQERVAGAQAPATSLRVIGLEPGAKPRTVLGPDPRVAYVYPNDWSLDGQAILCGLSLKSEPPQAGGLALAWISTSDGSVRTIKTFEPRQFPLGFRLSPDGRFIAYSATARAGANDRHIFVVDASGQTETRIVTIAGNNLSPLWTPTGSHILFTGDRSGTRAVWSVAVQGGKPTGEPSLVQAGYQTTGLIGMARSGDLYYAQSQGGGNTTFVAERRPTGARIVQAFDGMSASWSPNGKSLAFVKQTGQAYELLVRSVDTGEERPYPRPGGVGPTSPRWLHDGSGFLVLGRTDTGAALFSVDLKTGAFTSGPPIVAGVAAVSLDDRTGYKPVRPQPGAAPGPDNPFTGIVGIDLATWAESPVATFPGAGLAGQSMGLSLSPNGGTFAMNVQLDNDRGRLLTVRADGTEYRELHGPFPQIRPWDLARWTPDGRSILFVTAGASGPWRVMRIPATGGQPVPDGLDSATLTGSIPLPRLSPGTPYNIDLSPDGSRILFGAGTLPTFELWAIENITALLNAKR